jgi:8-oxo-dGTP pyrophosphatase MutT (NUDIX family)
MSVGQSRLPAAWSQPRPYEPEAKAFRLSHLRKMRGCEQVAAVCFRVRRRQIEFLLVQTRGRRWIFPKGSAEPGLTNAQAAALEAFEEAGVHGRIEESSFARYVRRKPARSSDSGDFEVTTSAHLCEVSRLDSPSEPNRNPTWFSPDKAKRRLRQERAHDYASELSLVIDLAVRRIRLSGRVEKSRKQLS